ncbi:MAG: helicase-associated domain-containing protein [Acidimicrobiales bacterium]
MPRAALSSSWATAASPKPRSDFFVERIASLDEAGLLELMTLRPDLGTPPAASLQDLATRANRIGSVQRCLDRMDRFSLQLLQALTIAGPDYGRARLLALLGPEVPEAEVDGVLDRLERQALIIRRTGRMILHPHVAEMATPARLGPPIAALVEPLGADDMRFVARSAGLKLDGKERKADLAAKLIEELPVPERVQRALASVSPAARELACRIAAGPPAVFVPYAPHLYATQRRAQSFNDIDTLAHNGLIFPQSWDRCVMPREIGLVLRGGRVFPDLAPRRPAIRTSEVSADRVDSAALRAAEGAVTVIEALGRRLGTQPAPTLKSGGLGVRELRKLADSASRSADEVTLLLEIGAAAKLFTLARPARSPGPDREPPAAKRRPGGRSARTSSAAEPSAAMPTPAFDEWLELSGPERWGALASAWLGTETFPSLAGTEDEEGRVAPLTQWGGSPGVVDHRLATLKALAAVPPGKAAEAGSLTAAVVWDAPMIIAKGPASAEMHIAWVSAEAELLGVMACGSISTVGRAVARCDIGEAVSLLEDLAEPASTDLVLQADLTAVAPGSAPRDFQLRLEQVADTESAGAAIVYRFTEASVRRGLDSGLTADGICELLQAHSARELPQALRYLIGDVARRHGTARVGSATSYVRFEEAAVATEVLRSRKTGALHLRQIAPTVLVSDAGPDAVLERLRSAGYLPAQEDASGSVVVPAARCHRGSPLGLPRTSDAFADEQLRRQEHARLACELFAGRLEAESGPVPCGRAAAPARSPGSSLIKAVFGGQPGHRVTIDGRLVPQPDRSLGGDRWGVDPDEDEPIDDEWDDDEDDEDGEDELDLAHEGTLRALASVDQRPTAIAKTRDEIRGLLQLSFAHDWIVRASSTDETGRTSESNATVLGVLESDVELLTVNGFRAIEVPIDDFQWARVLTEQEEDLL